MLKLYNTLTRQKEEFIPINPPKVTFYSCGPTVYDFPHIGNWFTFIRYDLFNRVLKANDYDVEWVMNITDVGHLTTDSDEGEDKLEKGAKREGATAWEVAKKYSDYFEAGLDRLNISPPQHLPRATAHIPEQIKLVQELESKGFTYVIDDGVYFDTSKFKGYGKLGNIDIEKLKSGARVDVNPEKHHPADFALWKKGLLGWDSAWGKGFPGWHIECTAMVFASLGKQIDIHTGGIDHIATHHNGEMAQAEAATGRPYVQIWMHNAFIRLDDQKISKSIGNTIGLSQLETRGFSPAAYRYWLLTGHYRSPMNFTFEALTSAKQALFRLKRYVYEDYKNKVGSVEKRYQEKFIRAVTDDLDTPKAVSIVWELIKDKDVPPENKVATLKDFDHVLGIGLCDPLDDVIRELGIVAPEEVPEEIQSLLDAREAARVARNWEEADRFREAINFKGYSLEDTPNGPRVTKN